MERGREYYDKLWADHDLDRSFLDEEIVTIIRTKFKRNKDLKILDVGCGSGRLMRRFQDSGYRFVHGVDISVEALKRAEERGINRDNLTQADIYNLKPNFFSDYDIIIFEEVLEHIYYDVDMLLREDLGGKFVVATVPDFPDESHVRYFRDDGEVRERYRAIFLEDFSIDRVQDHWVIFWGTRVPSADEAIANAIIEEECPIFKGIDQWCVPYEVVRMAKAYVLLSMGASGRIPEGFDVIDALVAQSRTLEELARRLQVLGIELILRQGRHSGNGGEEG